MTNVSSLPIKVKESGLFCVWKYEDRGGKKTKVPYNPRTGGKAQPNNAATFAPLSVAEAVQTSYDGLGVGIFGDLCAIDIDHCVLSGGLSEMAEDIISTMNAYTEYSPSGTGLRILFAAQEVSYDKAKYYINNQKIGLEVYTAGATQKYVTVTGNALAPIRDLGERSTELKAILDKYMKRHKAEQQGEKKAEPTTNLLDTDIIAKAHKASNGAIFGALWNGDTSGYNSQSEADLALCNILTFYAGKDAAQIDRLFRSSGLYRKKWDRPQSGSTYGAITIQNAIDHCKETYNPQALYQKKASAIKITGTTPKRLVDLHPDKNERYGWHDMGCGYLFADWYKDYARYVPERKKWFIYNGKIWQPDTGDLKVMELCKRLADNLMFYALSIQDERQRQHYMEFIKRWQRRNYRETVLKDAASVYPAALTAFDSDPMLFNCLNGTLNLETGKFYAHRPGDMLSKMSGVKYDTEAHSDRWEQFILEVMQGDQDEAAFLQKALGYALTGDTRHECFFTLYGSTSRNGKGTCMETFMKLMGDYGKTAKPETIAQKQTANGSGPSEDIARLAGARFVNISEPDKKLILSAALVKTLTGNDTVTARFLNENSFEYRPQFKLFINTNHLPAVTDVTLFSSGRVKIIPFERHFAETERDEGLKSELAKPENLSGILNWCIKGLWMIKETGFDMPEAVRYATDEYRQNSDKIGRFLDEEMEAGSLYEARTADVYIRYKEWCGRNGFYPENAANFKTSLSNIATVTHKRPSGSIRTASPLSLIIGYRLKSVFEPQKVVSY